MAERATARITAFNPGQSPPAVRIPIRIGSSLGSLFVRRLLTLLLGLCALLVAAGCGEGGVAGNATVSVYMAAPLCAQARGGHADDLKVRLVCLEPVEKEGKADLAAAGAGARRAIEDSTSVAYVEAPGPAAKFSRSIVEAADVAWVETSSGPEAMKRIFAALEGDGSTPRQAVLDEVG
jgi:hypothetical protein